MFDLGERVRLKNGPPLTDPGYQFEVYDDGNNVVECDKAVKRRVGHEGVVVEFSHDNEAHEEVRRVKFQPYGIELLCHVSWLEPFVEEDVCVCDIRDLMICGCKCGHLKRMRAKAAS